MDIMFNAREGCALRKNLMSLGQSYQVKSSINLCLTEALDASGPAEPAIHRNEEKANDRRKSQPRRGHQHAPWV